MIPWLRLWRRQPRRPSRAAPHRPAACRDCVSFRNDPVEIEAALPGFSGLSSGFGSVRSDDGLCLTHDRFVTAQSRCAAFRRTPISTPPPAEA